MRTRFLSHLLALTALMALAGCASQPAQMPKTVSHVDLDRYMGTWHVIANIPNFLEKGKVATADEYHRRKDGDIAITYHFRKGFDRAPDAWHGKGWLPDPKDAAHWKVRIIWPFVSDYLILALDPQYRYVMVGVPDRDLLWIMARDTTMPDDVYQQYVDQARAQGFPVDQLKRVPQTAAQVGQPGYQ
ncbi:lipocalin family protein [Oleiagrimonas soli]|uniref:Outer membrane lipoprotein Blc n=1 Tax=Oleiagrimonas soli TaxID=1543381 RepID=A0A841KHW4_9GAMM|nr:lipocalin family protein [Oleiagrimonas soli]MBB6184766.1 apolipoprotein D and lipocalin family protein [Oleiagrimonas soli]